MFWGRCQLTTQRVLLVEDSAPMRLAITEIVQRECKIIGCVEHGCEVLTRATELSPHTILLDISLPGISGLDLLPQLREALPQTAIVMLTNHADEFYRREAFARGADAYVLKGDAHTELLGAIRLGRTGAHRRTNTANPAREERLAANDCFSPRPCLEQWRTA